MEAGFVGELNQIPDGYRCYFLFLPNEMPLKGLAEGYIMSHFWEASFSLGDDALLTGIERGYGLATARKKFGLSKETKSAILLLDILPSQWQEDHDPIAIISLDKLKLESEAIDLLQALVRISNEPDFIGKTKRKQFFEKAKKYIRPISAVGEYIKLLIPSP